MKWRTKLLGVGYDIFLSVYFGLAFFWLILVVGVPFGTRGLLLLLLPAVCVIFFVSIFIHEIGHFTAAVAAGLKVTSFASWPMMITRSGRKWHLRPLNSPGTMLGAVGAFPTNVKHLAWKRGIYLSAGPMTSFLVAIASLVLAYALNEGLYGLSIRAPTSFWNRLMIPRNGTALLLLTTSMINLFHFIASLRPVPIKESNTDGAALIALIRDRRSVLRKWLGVALSYASQTGARPGKLDHEMIDYLLSLPDDSGNELSGLFFGFYYFLDRGQTDQAGDLIDLLAANRDMLDLRCQSYAGLEAAFFEARHRRNPVAARRWLDQAPKDGVEPQTYLRAEAAVLLAEGQCQAAAAIAKAALVVLPKSADLGGAIAEKEWLESILSESKRENAN
jgi:hypothetical protein